MPDIPTLTVTDASGTERGTIDGITAERSRHVTEADRAKITVDREKWQTLASDINERDDRFRIDAEGVTGWFGGRFRDTERGSQSVTVVIDGYERDARDGEPTGGQKVFQNVDDSTIVSDALSRVPTLSAGTIETVASNVSFSFANASPAKMIRDAAEPGGALVRYNADRTVDFIAQPETAESWIAQSGAGTTTLDVSDTDAARIRLRAPPGGESNEDVGGKGGAATVTIDVSNSDTITLHGADAGDPPTGGGTGGAGGAGLYDGGAGGSGDPGDSGAGGAGAVGVTDGGTELVIADGGGGAAGLQAGGGGGARGGVGGTGLSFSEDGEDGAGSGTGGDGGDANVATPEPGGDGSFEILDTDRVTLNLDEGTADVTTGEVTYLTNTLSPALGTLTGDASVVDDNRHPPTQIIGLGAQAGPNQVRVSATVDPNAAREVYRKYENKDIQNADRLQEIVDRLAAEVAAATEKIEVSGRGVLIDARPGEPVPVEWDAEDIDTTLRVVEFTEVVGPDGRRYAPIRVSNRWPEQGGADKRRADLERFNSGYQGFVDRDNFSLDSQPVTSSVNAEDSYFYPDDVLAEVRAEIRVRGRAYRALSSGAAGGEASEFVESFGSIAANDGLASQSQIELRVNVEQPPSGTFNGALFAASILNSTGRSDDYDVTFTNKTTGNILNFQANNTLADANADSFFYAADTSEVSVGDEVELRVDIDSGQWGTDSSRSFPLSEINFAVSTDQTHTHSPQPGLVEFSEFPSNCDVLVNGTSVGVSLGDGTGPFAETVDISGLLTPGDNQIEITSDTTGRITGAVRTELFRQGPEDTV